MNGLDNLKRNKMKEDIKCYCGHTTYCDCSPLEVKIHILDFNQIVKEPKQETLEEASYNYARDKMNRTSHLIGFREGAKWQQEQDNKELAMWKLAVERQEARCKALNSVISDLQEGMYSEEEVLNLLYERESELNTHNSIFDYQDAKEWFEQFKKK